MRTFYEKPDIIVPMYGMRYECDHPRFNSCTLFERKDKGKGLIVIQQRYDPVTKHTWWNEIDPWLANDIYLSRRFREAFDKLSDVKDDKGLYPVIEVRKLMWMVRLNPMPKEPWER